MLIYITGLNAYLLSSELATLLSGRYIEMYLLLFNEELEFNSYDKSNFEDKFNENLKFGGPPVLRINLMKI